MNLEQKLAHAKRLIDSIAKHDDAAIPEVRGTLARVAAYASESAQQAANRRLGTRGQRIGRYFVGIGRALTGRA